MLRLVRVNRVLHDRAPLPSVVMVDAQSVKGGRYGPTFHEAGGPGGRVFGTKRTLLVEILGLPVAAHASSARPHDVTAARELLRGRLDTLPRLRAVVGDRAYRGLTKLAARKRVSLDIKAPPAGAARLHPGPTPLQDRRLRPARALATAVALFERLVAQVMAHEPYASARRVFWIVDNGSSAGLRGYWNRCRGCRR